MSTLELFTYIILAIFGQIAIFVGIAFFQHWRAYVALKDQVTNLGVKGQQAESSQGKPELLADDEMWSGYRSFKVSRKAFEDPNQTICSFYLTPEDAMTLPVFQPGQFLTFQLEVTDPLKDDKTKIVRCYSLSERPGLDHYRISVKRVPAPADIPEALPGLSSNHFHDYVEEGDRLSVRAPGGHFYLHPGENSVVLIAGGIGITPIVSMLNTLVAQDSKREIHVFYGVRNGGEHAFKTHLQKHAQTHANVHLHVCYSRPRAEDTLQTDYQHKGHVNIDLLRMTLPMGFHDFYICGPGPMMETIVPALRDWGVPEPHIHFEAFGPASVPAPFAPSQVPTKAGDEASTVEVTFARSGKTLTWYGKEHSLLEFAEKNNIHVDSGCRSGACGACETAIEDGEVVYDNQPDHEPQSGHCLLCVSRPKRDLTLQA